MSHFLILSREPSVVRSLICLIETVLTGLVLLRLSGSLLSLFLLLLLKLSLICGQLDWRR